MSQRVIIVGGPRRGKSTLAAELRLPTFCTDPASTLLEAPRPGVTYLPEGLEASGDRGAAQWVVDNWLSKPGPWCVEGWLTARALRRWKRPEPPADRIIVLLDARCLTTAAQAAMTKGVRTVWTQVQHRFPFAEVR